MSDGIESTSPTVFEDPEFVDVDALYSEVRTLQRTLEQERADANDTREKAFKKVRGLQQEVERHLATIATLKRLEAKYYALNSEMQEVRDVVDAARAWAAAADVRDNMYRALAKLDGKL